MNGLKPGFFKWWNAPPVVALDVTNPAVRPHRHCSPRHRVPFNPWHKGFARVSITWRAVSVSGRPYPAAVEWFVARLKRLQTEYGIDGFKFDGGEPCFLPRMFETAAPLQHPSEYTRAYVNNIASRFELAEVRTVRFQVRCTPLIYPQYTASAPLIHP